MSVYEWFVPMKKDWDGGDHVDDYDDYGDHRIDDSDDYVTNRT